MKTLVILTDDTYDTYALLAIDGDQSWLDGICPPTNGDAMLPEFKEILARFKKMQDFFFEEDEETCSQPIDKWHVSLDEFRKLLLDPENILVSCDG